MAEFTMEGEMVALVFLAFLWLSNAYEVTVSYMMAYDEGSILKLKAIPPLKILLSKNN